MKSKYRYLSKNVLLFSLSGFVPKILSLILLPLYTGYLTTSEYGVSDLISTTVMLLVPIFTLDIQDAVMRFAMDEDYENQDVFSIGLITILKGGLLVVAGAWILSLFHINGLANLYLIFVGIMYFTASLNNTFSLFCRGIDHVKTLTIGSILNSAVTLSANILFLAVFRWGLVGYLIANSMGDFVSLVFVFLHARLYRYISLKVSVPVRKNMLNFSFPLIFSVIAWWVNNTSDRYILTWMAGISISGVYAVAYKIPNILTSFQNIFAQAWSISAIKEFDKNDSDGFIGRTYTLMNFVMVFMCSLIILLDIPIAHFLYAKTFFSAWLYVPPLLVSVVFNAMALFIGSIFTAVKDTRTLSISTIVGSVVNTVCNFIMIYFWQAYGAALATLIGYGVTLIMRQIILRKHVRMKVRLKRDMIVYGVLLAQVGVSYTGLVLIPLQVVLLLAIVLLHWQEAKISLAMIRTKVLSF